jgi:S1-C subfamily serine protease
MSPACGVGQFGEHAAAKRAGFLKDDTLIAFDGQHAWMSESELIAYSVQHKRPGDVVSATVLRGGEQKTMSYALP